LVEDTRGEFSEHSWSQAAILAKIRIRERDAVRPVLPMPAVFFRVQVFVVSWETGGFHEVGSRDIEEFA
jgi:hypothetical protein